MKKFLRDILFGDIAVREYCTVRVPGEIYEKVFLSSGNRRIDITRMHWLLCLEPLVFGVWFDKERETFYPAEEGIIYELQFLDGAERPGLTAVLKLVYFNSIEQDGGILLLLKLSKLTIHHIGIVRTRLLFYKYYKKPEQSFFKLKSYAAAYSYPRKVRLVSFQEDNWYNIFPMDLVGDIPTCGRYVFGLRHSNVTLARIIEQKKIVVSEIPFEKKDIIYQLGKHHRKPLSETGLSFEVVQSETFRFPVPDWTNSYKEIRITNTLNLGSHMLLWGEVVNEKYLADSRGHLYHIHFLHYLHQLRRGLSYPLV